MTARVIDTCVKINLLATGREEEIVRALGCTLIDTPQISNEALGVWTLRDADGIQHREPASDGRLRAGGLLHTRALDSGPLVDAYVEAAARITDGDASCIAVAGVLGLPLVTDDRMARRVARSLYGTLVVIGTLDLIAEAAAALGWGDDELASVAFDLRWRGKFSPPRSDPRRDWYAALIDR